MHDGQLLDAPHKTICLTATFVWKLEQQSIILKSEKIERNYAGFHTERKRVGMTAERMKATNVALLVA